MGAHRTRPRNKSFNAGDRCTGSPAGGPAEEPTTPPAPAIAPVNLELAALEVEKARLEVEKLKEEVETAREGRSWWRRSIRDVKLSEWVTAIAAVVALGAAFWTGWFSATRERNAAQGDRLEVERIHLENRKEKLVADVAAKEKDLAEVRARLLPFEEEQAALRELRNVHETQKLPSGTAFGMEGR
jgi:hypothetical protein